VTVGWANAWEEEKAPWLDGSFAMVTRRVFFFEARSEGGLSRRPLATESLEALESPNELL
jgi:hypothetical protein